MIFDIHWKREYPLWNSVSYMYALQELFRRELNTQFLVRVESEGTWMKMMSEEGSKHQFVTTVKKSILEKEGYAEAAIARVHAEGEIFVSIGKNLDVKGDLEQQFGVYFTACSRYATELFMSFYLVEIISGLFSEYITNVHPENAIEVIESHSVPSHASHMLRIATFFKEHHDIDERVSYIQKTYPGIGNIDPFTQPFTEKQIREFAESFIISKENKFSPEPVDNTRFVRLYQAILYLKDKRDDYRRESFFFAYPFMVALAKKNDISVDDLKYLLPNELASTVNLAERKTAYIAELTDHLEITTENAREHFMIVPKGNTEVQGIVGAKGHVRGTVYRITSVNDVPSFQEGSILVAITTDPNYITAMQKAIAFVTDEGGIACHAAIVARELGVPCIVGTGNASNVFKTGDMIEVDAENGVVRKI